MLLKVNTDGSQVRLRDVARIELGAESYSVQHRVQRPAGGGPGDQARHRRQRAGHRQGGARHAWTSWRRSSRPGLKLIYPYDTTPFVRVSIEEVVKTLFEAIVLVFLVMYLFLQNFRATLIPTIAVPVVLLGTFGDPRPPRASRSTR